MIDGFAHLGALAVAQPADARGQPLKCKAATCKSHPASEDFVVGKKLERQFVGDGDVFGIAGERDPSEGTLAGAEERANVFGHEAGDEESVGASSVKGEAADVIAVVKGDRAGALQCE